MDEAYNDSLQIWKAVCEFKNQNITNFEEEVKKFHDKIAKDYPNFFYSFPIVGKLIVLSSMFTPRCMKNFLEHYFAEKKEKHDFEEFVSITDPPER